MISRRVIIFILAALLLAPATIALGQKESTPVQEVQEPQNSMPGVGEVLDVIEKASAPDPARKDSKDWSSPVKLAVVFAVLAVLPSVLVMTTSFTRIVIVLGFVRRALTTQNVPPTVAIIGLAIFLTMFTMAPTFSQINENAVKPYLADEIPFDDACTRGNALMKDFMLHQTRKTDLSLFLELASIQEPSTAADVPMYVAIPAFAISEFRTAFEMGCLLFIPFLLIDLVVAGILLSAGMMMMPPSMVSLPFKIVLFVLVDGWRLLAQALVSSFH